MAVQWSQVSLQELQIVHRSSNLSERATKLSTSVHPCSPVKDKPLLRMGFLLF